VVVATPLILWRCTEGTIVPSILITGANRGLGFEFARQYGADGWRVFATCRNPKSATALQNWRRLAW
jgi:NAD(P)-dependent dehydrogenase (short-subunit alcohol dehydrogenase family)